jgi:hypothetical protein
MHAPAPPYPRSRFAFPLGAAAKAGVDREAGDIYLSDAFSPLFRPLDWAWGGGYEDSS